MWFSKLCGFLVSFFVLSAGLCVYGQQTTQRSVSLTWAHRILLPKDWKGFQSGEYWWLPSGELLSIEGNREKNNGKYIARFSPSTKKIRPRLTLHDTLCESGDVSADGRYFLAYSHLSPTAVYRLADGQKWEGKDAGVGGSVQWIYGNRSWLELVTGTTGNLSNPALVYIGDRQTLKVRLLLPNSPQKPINTTYTAALSGRGNTLYALDIDGEMPGVAEKPMPTVKRATLRIMQIDRRVREISRHEFPLPKRGQLREANFSPNCERIAFVMRFPHDKSKYRETLYVCRRSGNPIQIIGSVAVDNSSEDREGLRFVKWLPNARQVSFVYRDVLHTAPISQTVPHDNKIRFTIRQHPVNSWQSQIVATRNGKVLWQEAAYVDCIGIVPAKPIAAYVNHEGYPGHLVVRNGEGKILWRTPPIGREPSRLLVSRKTILLHEQGPAWGVGIEDAAAWGDSEGVLASETISAYDTKTGQRLWVSAGSKVGIPVWTDGSVFLTLQIDASQRATQRAKHGGSFPVWLEARSMTTRRRYWRKRLQGTLPKLKSIKAISKTKAVFDFSGKGFYCNEFHFLPQAKPLKIIVPVMLHTR